MSLLALERGCLREAIAKTLGHADPAGVALESPASTDLFTRAFGHHAIVYGPAPCLLDGKLDPSPDVDRMRNVLRAANAPGVALVVVVIPEGDAYQAEIDALRRDGKPYIIVRAPALLEEVANSSPPTAAKASGFRTEGPSARCVAKT